MHKRIVDHIAICYAEYKRDTEKPQDAETFMKRTFPGYMALLPTVRRKRPKISKREVAC